uniref:Putative armadillo-type fold protein n=1 Tax=Tanacetum cinerariifolium TaxID=118510 RepID=A0A6L2JSP3_TANCI|nr:putative armadillo-type fold protein [Tanacetum cinerariifolium]
MILCPRNVEVATESVIALGKFTSPDNFLCAEHSKTVVEFEGVQPLMRLLRGSERTQYHALVLLCYLSLHAGSSETFQQARLLTALEGADKAGLDFLDLVGFGFSLNVLSCMEHHDYVVLDFLLEETYDPDLMVLLMAISCSMLRMIECQCWFYVERIREINPEVVIPSSFQELEVRKGDESYGVNLIRKQCQCRFWEISGIPCVHVVARYMHLNKDPDVRVGQWIKAPSENNSQVSRSGRRMTCSNYLEVGHNKTTCDKYPVPKTPKHKKTPGRKSQPKSVSYASSRCRGRGSKGRGGGRGFRGAHAGRGVSGRGGLGVQPQQEFEDKIDVDAMNKTPTLNNLNVNTHDSVAVHMEEDVVEADVVDALIQD